MMTGGVGQGSRREALEGGILCIQTADQFKSWAEEE